MCSFGIRLSTTLLPLPQQHPAGWPPSRQKQPKHLTMPHWRSRFVSCAQVPSTGYIFLSSLFRSGVDHRHKQAKTLEHKFSVQVLSCPHMSAKLFVKTFKSVRKVPFIPTIEFVKRLFLFAQDVRIVQTVVGFCEKYRGLALSRKFALPWWQSSCTFDWYIRYHLFFRLPYLTLTKSSSAS